MGEELPGVRCAVPNLSIPGGCTGTSPGLGFICIEIYSKRSSEINGQGFIYLCCSTYTTLFKNTQGDKIAQELQRKALSAERWAQLSVLSARHCPTDRANSQQAWAPLGFIYFIVVFFLIWFDFHEKYPIFLWTHSREVFLSKIREGLLWEQRK